MNELLKKIEEYELDVQFRIIGRRPWRVDGFKGIDIEAYAPGFCTRIRITDECYEDGSDDNEVFKKALKKLIDMFEAYKGEWKNE